MTFQRREVLAHTRRMAEVIAHHTGRDLVPVNRDIDRDLVMTAAEAVDDGPIDGVIRPRRGLATAQD